MKKVEFFFDVGSPYTYLAYHQLPKIAKARNAEIVWRPMLLGGVFQATGNSSPATVPIKGQHSMVDLERWARHFDVPFQHNPYFPINTLHLMRGAAGMQMRSEEEFQRYLAAVFSAMFEKPRNLGAPEEVAAVLEAAGVSPLLFLELVKDEQVKEKLKRDTQEAIERGVFGAPTFFVGADMFWGQDRLHFVDLALA
ncbi:MAG: 2-hydroxychromene-2-carboxylate isomerase [Pseudomonadota bacterium]